MYYYETSSVDYFFGMLTFDEFCSQVQKETEDCEQIIGYTQDKLKEAEEYFRFNSMWEGDIKSGPVIFAIPDPDCASYREGFVWKQHNNGTSFIASPCPIPWLEEYRLK